MVIAVVLLLVGASKIPELVRSMGKAAGEFKKARIESETVVIAMENNRSSIKD